MMADNFVHLHTHSDHSKLDGCGRVAEYVEVAAERGNPAIGFSEHGTMRGIHELTKLAGEAEIKPIYGIEFYVCEDMHRRGLTEDEKLAAAEAKGDRTKAEAIKDAEAAAGIRKRHHLSVWAKNDAGLRNLYRLSSSAWLDGYYYRPRIDLAALEAHGEGLYVATGCLGSPVNDRLLQGKTRAAEKVADRLFDRFGEDLFLEVMPHDLDGQRTANRFALDLRDRYGGEVRLLATQDAHYVKPEDAAHHEVLLCIGTGSKMSDPDRFRFPGPADYWFKDRKAIAESFDRHHGYMAHAYREEAMDSTILIGEAATASITLDRFKCLLPPVDMPGKWAGDEFGYLFDLCKLGWQWREIKDRAQRRATKLGVPVATVKTEYSKRLAMELSTLRDRGIVPYFLIVRDIYEWARRQSVACGPGRGSSAGSMVAFLLGITAVDPIEHGLLFERFISPGRVDMPDIDCDFEDVRRDDVLEYVRQKYGTERVSQIATMGQLGARQCLDDVARVYELPYLERKRLTSEVGGGESLKESLDRSPVLQRLRRENPKILEHALALEGLNKTPGMHAAGIVASPVPLVDVVPMETRAHGKKRVVVTALDMYGIQDFGLLKLDLLGLRTITVVRMAVERIAEGGEVVDMERVPLDDADTLAAFTAHDYAGIFQFDSASAEKVTRGAEFESFDDIAIYNALNRPGTTRSGLAEEYAKRRADPGSIKWASYHEWTKPITGETLGIILYQEQVIRVLTDVAGYSAGDADQLRRKIGKSMGADEIRKESGKFIAGAVRTHPDMPQEVAEELMGDIEQFGAYGFNRCAIGDTVLSRGDGTTITVEEAFQVQRSPSPLGDKFRCGRWRVLQMDADGQVRPGVVKAIYDNGIRPTIKITTTSGRSIVATGNHRLLTSHGYQRVDRLGIGSSLVCMGVKKVVRKGRSRRKGKRWIDGRVEMFAAAKKAVATRVGDFCELCGIPKAGRFEFAHTRSLESLSGDYSLYHNADNIRLLCNSCHKRLDYLKGERVPAWTRGKPTELDRIVSIEAAGDEQVYDVEMATSEHNFIANGIVSHNSHAVAYGMISYWCQWLKVHHPLAFYWALLCVEPSVDNMRRYVADARSHGIDVVPPDVNRSGGALRIDDEAGVIVGSLGDIKEVGPRGAAVIEAAQPFADLADFLDRTPGRAVNRKVITALIKSGAFGGMVGNAKWLVESLEDLWNIRKKRKLTAQDLTPPSDAADYSDEDRLLLASGVSPIAAEDDPFDLYLESVSDAVGVELTHDPFTQEDPPRYCWLGGIVVEASLYSIGTGDVFDGRQMTATEKARNEWGKRAGYFVLASSLGTDRFRIDDVAAQHPEIIEAGKGQPLLVLASVNAQREAMRAIAMVNLADMRGKINGGEELSPWDELVAGKEPAQLVKWKTKAERRGAMSLSRVGVSSIRATGIVAAVREKVTKHGKPMAIFHLIGPKAPRLVFCFDEWPDYRAALQPGTVATMTLGRSEVGGWVLARGPVRVLKRGIIPAVVS
ncbi:hypothetical protein LCGC14_1011170 [marine sediment metagenome]|uniref:DNA-directed DNA polymerase n=1 Tax=marine sediment metagenome TaxID=412755 RepID=A0A0F9N4Q8_9ZZZZ